MKMMKGIRQEINPKNKQRVKKTSKNKTDPSIEIGTGEFISREDVQRDKDTCIKDILRKMSDDKHNMQDLVNKRMNTIELKIAIGE